MTTKKRHTTNGTDSSMLSAGYQVIAKLAAISWFQYFATPDVGSSTISGLHVLQQGEEFIECYVLPESIKVDGETPSTTAGAVQMNWKPEFFIPGDGAELKEWINAYANEPLVLLVSDPSGQTLQFGTEKSPLYFVSCQFVSGAGSSGQIKGYKVQCQSTERYLYNDNPTIREILISRCHALGYPLDTDHIVEEVYNNQPAIIKDKSSFLLVPLGYHTGVVYALDSFLFPLPVAFSRGSSATRYNALGMPEVLGNNIPRIDHDSSSLSPIGYMREPASTNLISHSETNSAGEIYNAWGNYAGYQAIAQSGSYGPFKEFTITEDSLLGEKRVFNGSGGVTSPTDPSVQTLTFQVKANGCAHLQINNNTRYDLNAGTSDGTSPHRITPLPDGWYEIETSFTLAGTSIYWVLFMTDSNYNVNYQGDGVSGIKLRMIQLEHGECGTSYIPTYGSQASRLEESFSYEDLQANDLLNNDSGASYIEVPQHNGTATNDGKGIRLLKGADITSDHFAYSIRSGDWKHHYDIDGAAENNLNNISNMKVATQFGAGSLKQYHEGIRVLDVAYIDTMYLSRFYIDGADYCMHLSVLALFKEGLLNAELISISS